MLQQLVNINPNIDTSHGVTPHTLSKAEAEVISKTLLHPRDNHRMNMNALEIRVDQN